MDVRMILFVILDKLQQQQKIRCHKAQGGGGVKAL